MRCYYEVLGIERSSTPDEIKKAHRKLALKWHPDKNPDNREECHNVYQVIQEAYDCLSDPQEHAFYDKHREQILRGGSDLKDDDLNVMGFFHASCYKGFNDELTGFYAVYTGLFTRISEADYRYTDTADWEEPPVFGNSMSEFEVVRLFYGWWQSYCTKKNFLWLDALYDIRQADGRRILRAMEKENKKLIDDAKKEYNEQVRTLALHIKKKDPRCLAQKERQKQIEEERAVSEKKKKDEMRRKRAEEIAMLTKREKDNIAQLDEQVDDLLDEYSDSGEEEDAFYCPLCKKLFKSSKMMKQHEMSKKHREKLSELQEEFSSELAAAGLSTEPQNDTDRPIISHASNKKKKKKKKNRRQQQSEDMYDLGELNGEASSEEQVVEELDKLNIEEEKAPESPVEPDTQTDKQTDTQTLPNKPTRPEPDADIEDWTEYLRAHRTSEDAYYCGFPTEMRPATPEKAADERCCDCDYTIINTDTKPEEPELAGPKQAKCNMCNEEFPSKSKLFVHLTATGHAIKPEFAPKQQQTGKNKKNKNRKR